AEAGDEFQELLDEPFQEQPEQELAEQGDEVADFLQDSDFPAVTGTEAAGAGAATDPVPAATAVAAAAGPEVTVIIDDRQPGTQKKVIVIPRASPWLRGMLTGDRAEAAPEAPAPAVRRTAAKMPAEAVPPAEARFAR
ncbi:MAG: hypothetical protein ACK5YO_19910, partial [Planctomyces sp.]